jgi:hypothetical protein
MPRKPRLPEPLEIEGLSTGKPNVPVFEDDLSDAVIDPSANTPSKLSPEEARWQYCLKHGGPQGNAKVQPETAQPKFTIMHDADGELALSRGRSHAVVPQGQHIRAQFEHEGETKYFLEDNKPWRRL